MADNKLTAAIEARITNAVTALRREIRAAGYKGPFRAALNVQIDELAITVTPVDPPKPKPTRRKATDSEA